MYNEDIVKEFVKSQVRSLIDRVDDKDLKFQIIQDLYEEITSDLLDSDRIN